VKRETILKSEIYVLLIKFVIFANT